MKRYLTKLKAIDPATGFLCEWAGMDIYADSQKAAQRFCIDNGMGYLTVIGEAQNDTITELLLLSTVGNREN